MSCGQRSLVALPLSCLGPTVLLHQEQVYVTMCHKLTMGLAMFLLAACAGCTDAPGDAVDAAKGAAPSRDPIEDIAAEFRGLRSVQGHFDGGDWNDDVDKWMGRKHRLMIQLGTHMGSGGYGRAKVVRLLGSPDRTASPGDDLFELVDSLPEFERPTTGPYEFLIYYWRGTHDFLYFISQGETILNSGWWYAGE